MGGVYGLPDYARRQAVEFNAFSRHSDPDFEAWESEMTIPTDDIDLTVLMYWHGLDDDLDLATGAVEPDWFHITLSDEPRRQWPN